MQKSFQISASGLKNIIFNNAQSDNTDFLFQFCDMEVHMKQIYAEFISPRVSRIHQSDPTISSIQFSEFINNDQSTKQIINKSLLNKFELMSKGEEIPIDEETIRGIRILSILLDNFDLYQQINSISPLNLKEINIDEIIDYMKFIYIKKDLPSFFEFYPHDAIIDILSKNFYQIDIDKLLTLPKSVIYSIISNQHLKLPNEDYLLDFINKLFSSLNGDDKKDRYHFYETIEIENLSEEKFNQLIEDINPDLITFNLWNNLKKCFYSKYLNKNKEKVQERYSRQIKSKEGKYKEFIYDNNSDHRFQGIVYKLTERNPKSSIEKGIIDITSSSTKYPSDQPQNLVDFENDNSCFYSIDEPNSWIMFDFKERKVKPSHYSIKDNKFGHKDHFHLQNWVFEGSNNNSDWITLDTRVKETSLNDCLASNTFNISKSMSSDEYYQYLRLRQTGVNTSNNNSILINAIEIFGTVHEP